MQRIFQRSARQLRAAPRASPLTIYRPVTASFSTTSRCLASSDYGSGEVKPGRNPSEDKEHPGPPAPDTKGSSTISSGSGSGRPTIHHEPMEGSQEAQTEEVRKHNEEMEKRQAKSHDKDGVNDPKDKVPKGYWKGEGDA